MTKYYCPYCSRHKISINESYGLLICDHCGDNLIKKPFLNIRSVIGLITASVFLVPLLMMINFLIKDLTKEKIPNNSELTSLLAMVILIKS